MEKARGRIPGIVTLVPQWLISVLANHFEINWGLRALQLEGSTEMHEENSKFYCIANEWYEATGGKQKKR